MAGYGFGFGSAARRRLLGGGAGITPVTFTAPLLSSTRFGSENSYIAFSGFSTVYTTQGQVLLGTNGVRSIAMNTPNLPSTGDFAYVGFFRTPATGSTSSARYETLLGVSGAAPNGGTGGQFGFTSTSVQAGTSGNYTIDSTNSGRITIRRQHSSGWQLFPQTTVGANLTTIQLVGATRYLYCIAVKNVAGSDFCTVTIVDLATGTAQTATSNALSASARPSAPLFNLAGSSGATGTADKQGFGGSIGETALYTGAAPTTAQLQAVAAGTDTLANLATTIGGTCVWRNLFDYSTVSSGALASAVGSNATVTANVLGLETANSFRTTGVRISVLGPYWVFPFAIGQTTGKAWIESSGLTPGDVYAGFLRYTDGTTSAQVRGTVDGSGNLAIGIDSPISKPFYRSLGKVSDPTDCHNEFDIMDIGVVEPWFGQSETVIQFSSGWTSTVSLTPQAVGESGLSVTTIPGGSPGPWASVHDYAQRANSAYGPHRIIGPKARPERLVGRGVWGDGIMETAAKIVSGRSCSVMFVCFARSGHTMDQFFCDGIPFTQTVTLSGSGSGPYTLTLAMGSTDLQNKFGPSGLGWLTSGEASALQANGTFNVQIKPATFSLDLGGGVVITDTATDFGTGTLSGTNVASGTINYVNTSSGTAKANISVTFTGTPASVTGSMTWTPKGETNTTGNSNKLSNLDGWGVGELFRDVASKGLRYGWTLGNIFWSTAHSGETVASVNAKWKIMWTLAKSLIMSGVDANMQSPPIVICQKGRDTANLAADTSQRLMAETMWNAGYSWVLPGGCYYDTSMDSASAGPHQSFAQDSGPRIGRRMGAYHAMHLNGTFIPEPRFRAGAADRDGTGTILTIPLDSTSIANGLTLTVNTGGNANALDEWYQGGTVNPTNLIPNDATTIARIKAGGQAVELVKLSGTWAVGAETLVYYVQGGPATTQAPPASLLYDSRGGFSNEPGLLAKPKLS